MLTKTIVGSFEIVCRDRFFGAVGDVTIKSPIEESTNAQFG